MISDRVPAQTLSDEDLRHELSQLKYKQSDIEQSGTAAQQANHSARTGELEAEFLRRFPAHESGADESAAGPDDAGTV